MEKAYDKLIEKVEKYIIDNGMIQEEDKIILGVSGGADSMTLLDVLVGLSDQYMLSLYVVHVNHGIRGLEADEDEQFVKEECDKYINSKSHYITLQGNNIRVQGKETIQSLYCLTKINKKDTLIDPVF